MAVAQSQAACDARFVANAASNYPVGPITYGCNSAGTSFPGTVGVVGVQPTTQSGNDKGPFPGWEQDQFR